MEDYIIKRRYPSFRVPGILTSALCLENSYLVEDRDAIIFILCDEDENILPHTWGAASFKARVERLRSHVEKHEAWCRWKVDNYLRGSYCNI